MSGHKFSVGEVVLALRWDYTWHECEICYLPTGKRHACECRQAYVEAEEYLIRVPAFSSECACGLWSANEKHLRKRPQPGSEIVRSWFKDLPVNEGETA